MAHHEAHALSAFAYSGFEDAAVLVLDGRGAWEATSLWRGRNGRLEHLRTIPWPNSSASFTRSLLTISVSPYSDEWKVMGLAPYGEPGINLRDFIVPNDNPYRVPLLCSWSGIAIRSAESSRAWARRPPESEIDARHKNLAFAVQDMCEQAMLTLARAAVAQTGCRNLCLAGGVALNSKANGKIVSSGIVDRFFRATGRQ